MEITGRHSIGGPSTKLGFDKSKITCFRCKQKGISSVNVETHLLMILQICSEKITTREQFIIRTRLNPPRMKQLEDNSKEKSRALAVIHDDEGFD
ncbi:hypothetical protein Hanom_Chr05g00399341 [Helianthus anomalus]